MVEDERYTNPVYKTWLSLQAKIAVLGENALSEPERIFRCVYLLDLEIWNGYYDQYFRNSYGDYAGEIVSSLHIIGADKVAQLTEQAVQHVFPDSIPVERSIRETIIKVKVEQDQDEGDLLGQLGRAYCSNDAEDVFPLLENFAREHGFLVS